VAGDGAVAELRSRLQADFKHLVLDPDELRRARA
jgi:hypothetical protein